MPQSFSVPTAFAGSGSGRNNRRTTVLQDLVQGPGNGGDRKGLQFFLKAIGHKAIPTVILQVHIDNEIGAILGGTVKRKICCQIKYM